MKVLLDTHALLWLDINPSMLSSTAIEIIKNPGSDQKQEMILHILCLFSVNYRFS